MADTSFESLDPRIRRTRELLQQALGKLLKKKEFDEISVQDITETASLNRATFYDHYNDKFALLECMVGSQFHDLLAKRKVHFDGGCTAALNALVLAVCDYLSRMLGVNCKNHPEPHMESAIIAVVRRMLLEGLKARSPKEDTPPEMIAAAVSWAIYGAAKEWVERPNRCSSEETAAKVVRLVSPMLQTMEGA
jgi:AcrR family transcriptional regulator